MGDASTSVPGLWGSPLIPADVVTSFCGPVKGILEIGKWEDDVSSFNPDGKCLTSNAWGPGYVSLLRKKSPSLKCGVGSVPGDSCALARNFCKVWNWWS